MTLNDRVGSYTYPQGVVGQPYGPAHPHAVSTAGGISYAYDYNGNLTSGNGRTITWHYDNKPRTITAGGTTVTYVYDYAGQRAKKTVGSTTTRYIGKLYECTGSTCTAYIFGGNQRIAKKVSTTLTYYHQDHLGSTAAMSNSSGASAGDYAYYPYGETLYASGTEKYRFTAQELDTEHGLYNYNAREYDPVLGRFISPDSIVQDFSDPQTLNRYSYCRNNPLLYVDPSGNLFFIDDLTIGALLISMAKGAAIGAAVGATVSAVTGGDIGKGALTGAISGAFFGGAGTIIQTGGLEGVVAAKAAIHSAAGAISSGINASITGGNIGIEMGIGAVSAGMGSFAGHYLPKDLLIQTGARSLIGGLSGGVAAELFGGSFGRGFQSGAVTAGIGALANEYHNIFFDWFGNTAVPWLREQYRNFVGGEKAYADLTITFPIPVFPFLMGSGSFLTESNGTYYIQGCIGFGTGFGVSITGSPSTPVPGYFIAGQGSFIKTAQLGYSFAPNGGWFFEGGVTRPMAGWSFLGCRVFGPFGN
jgi:RHS repeat-associated protein